MHPDYEPPTKQPGDSPPNQFRTRTLQPISSEESIRQAAAEQPAVEPPIPPTSSAGETPEMAETHAEIHDEPSNFMTEPISRPPVAPHPTNPHPAPKIISHAPAKRSFKSALVLAVCSVAAMAVAFVGYGYFMWERVSPGDLMQVQNQTTSYLRPEQWKPIPGKDGYYGDLRGKDNLSSALFIFMQLPNKAFSGKMSDSAYNSIRSQLVTELNTLPSTIGKSTNACKSGMNVKSSALEGSSGEITNLSESIFTCIDPSENFLMKLRTVIGDDGYLRMIAVGATGRYWENSEEAFGEILDSISLTDQDY